MVDLITIGYCGIKCGESNGGRGMATFVIKIKPDGDIPFGDLYKDPSDVVDFDVDWSQFLQANTISSIVVAGTDITVDSSSYSGNVVSFTLSDGTDGTTAKVVVKVVTSSLTFERTIYIKVKNL